MTRAILAGGFQELIADTYPGARGLYTMLAGICQTYPSPTRRAASAVHQTMCQGSLNREVNKWDVHLDRSSGGRIGGPPKTQTCHHWISLASNKRSSSVAYVARARMRSQFMRVKKLMLAWLELEPVMP